MTDTPSVEKLELTQVIGEAKRLGIWTYMATASAAGRPYVTPVHPGWEGETLWTMVELNSAKAKNVAANPQVSCTRSLYRTCSTMLRRTPSCASGRTKSSH